MKRLVLTELLLQSWMAIQEAVPPFPFVLLQGSRFFTFGMGEKLSDLEQFYPDRMASRILGMGDILSLIEKAGDPGGRRESQGIIPEA